jgi:N-acyl-D-amino-acid deacylase
MEIVIRDVQIVDGSGDPAFYGDIGIQDGRFVYFGPGCKYPRELEVKGDGLTAAPGFFDIHSHSDYYLLVNPLAESKVRQGVTTEIGGNCGYSAAPIFGKAREERVKVYQDLFGLDLPWEGVGEYLAHLDRQRIAVNFGLLIGHNTVRASVMYGSDKAPSSEELEQMVQVVKEGMREGAVGFSTGLIYSPACFSEANEMIALCKAVREEGGIFTTHMRSEGNRLLEAVDEVIGVAEKAGIPLQISHLKTSGTKNWKKLDDLFERIESAQGRGVDVTADRYPYTASNTGLSAVLPDWAFEGGTDRMMERYKDPEIREKLRREIETEHPEEDYFERIMISAVTRPENHRYVGRRVKECAREEGKDPVEFICDLLLSERNMVDAIYFTMKPENLSRILKKPYVMIGSDSGAKSLDGPLGEGCPHPRAYGTYPRILQQFVREEGVLSLEEGIRKMTSDPLRRFGIRDRGLIREGLAADLVLFDPEHIKDLSTYEESKKYPSGIEMVLVNGEIVVDGGEHTGRKPGKILTVTTAHRGDAKDAEKNV